MREKLVAMVAFLLSIAGAATTRLHKALTAMPKLGSWYEVEAQKRADRGQLGLGTIIAALIVVIAAFLAIIVVDEMNSSLGDPSNSDLQNSSDAVLDGFSSMTQLIAPLLLVAISVVIIGLVQRLRG